MQAILAAGDLLAIAVGGCRLGEILCGRCCHYPEAHNAAYAFACRSIHGAVAASAMAIMLSMARMARAT